VFIPGFFVEMAKGAIQCGDRFPELPNSVNDLRGFLFRNLRMRKSERHN
jgi:hypothetical protein